MNYGLRDSMEDESQRMLNAIEPGTVIPVHRHTSPLCAGAPPTHGQSARSVDLLILIL